MIRRFPVHTSRVNGKPRASGDDPEAQKAAKAPKE